ncbi:MAG: MCE family protein [Bacteroidales bacterium]|nr:MCE family protein [Bacteroidales bacterium]
MKLSREFKIGITAVIALALLIWGINYLKGINVFKKTATYYVVYNDISGLIESAVVFLNGYKVGNVAGIDLELDNPDRIVVEMALDKRIKLARPARAVIRSSSLISGVKDIYLEIGDGPGTHAEGDTLQPEIEVEIFDFIDPVVAKIESLVTSVDSVLMVMDAGTRANLQDAVEDISDVMASLKQSLQPEGSLSKSFANFESVSENLKQSNENITDVLNNLASVSDSLKRADIKALIAHLDQTLMQTGALFKGIREGEGTAGQLVVNDSLYRNLNRSLASLDSLLIDLKEHPGRYVHLSVFGRKDR